MSKLDVGEADSLFVIYTKDFGKIRALARGVKKPEAKLKGHLEPLSLSLISFVLGRGGECLTSASLINFWPSLRVDNNRLSAALYLTGLVDHHCMAGEKDEPLWQLLVNSLLSLEENKFDRVSLISFLSIFETELAHKLGYGDRTDLLDQGKPMEKPI